MKRLFFLPLAAILILGACSHKSLPEGVMDADQMVEFLVEAYRLEAYNTVMYRGNTSFLAPERRAAYDDILRRQGIDRETVEKSLEYYSNHPREYKDILDTVSSRMSNQTIL